MERLRTRGGGVGGRGTNLAHGWISTRRRVFPLPPWSRGEGGGLVTPPAPALPPGAVVLSLAGHGDWVRAVVVHPGGRFLLSAGDDKARPLLPPLGCRPVAVAPGVSLAHSPGGGGELPLLSGPRRREQTHPRRLPASGLRHAAGVLRRAPMATPTPPTGRPTGRSSLTFPLAVPPQTIRVWDVATGRAKKTYAAQGGADPSPPRPPRGSGVKGSRGLPA